MNLNESACEKFKNSVTEKCIFDIFTYLLPAMPGAKKCSNKGPLLLCLFCRASFAMVPQVWFRVFISSSTVRRQVFFGLPLLRLPSGIQCRAVLVMLPGSFLLSTCPVYLHLLLMMMVSIQSWRQRARSCSFEMLLGQKILRIHPRLFVWKTESLLRVTSRSSSNTLSRILTREKVHSSGTELQLSLCKL